MRRQSKDLSGAGNFDMWGFWGLQLIRQGETVSIIQMISGGECIGRKNHLMVNDITYTKLNVTINAASSVAAYTISQ